MTRIVSRAMALALLGALFVTPSAAWATEETVVSTDGVTWAKNLATPLFDPAARWVPGDERVSNFYVGNRTEDAADVAVVARAKDRDALIALRDVDLAVRSGNGAWSVLPADGKPHLLRGLVIEAGANLKISVRARLRAASTNRSQARTVPLGFDVVLSHAISVQQPTGQGAGQGNGNGDGGGVGGIHGLLPDTGGVDFRILTFGLLLTALGSMTILIAARRKDQPDE